jgi:hypothetical protein
MSVSPNTRLPCGETSSSVLIPTLGSCYETVQTDSSGSNSDLPKIKYNVTKMLNYSASHLPQWIDPFEIANGGGLEANCSPYASDPPQNFICGDGINGNVWCWPQDDSIVQPCPTGSFSTGNFHNCYSQSQDTQSQCPPRKLGFKNLYAHKAWIGKRSYTSPDNQIPDDWDWCCDGCTYQFLHTGSVDSVKYRSVSATSYFNTHTDVFTYDSVDTGTQFCCADGYTECTCGDEGCGEPTEIGCTTFTFDHSTEMGGNADAATTIDIYGNIIAASCSSGSHGCSGDYSDLCAQGNADTAFGMLPAVNSNAGALISQWCGDLKTYGSYAAPDVVTKNGLGSWTIEWHVDITLCTAGCGGPLDSTTELAIQMVITPSTYDLYTYGPKPQRGGCTNDTHCYTWIQTMHFHMGFGETDYTQTFDTTGIGSISFDQTYHQETGGSLQDPYTIKQVYDEVVNLMSYWSFGDETVYPWRQDALINMGPVVYHDEGEGEPYVPACQTSSLFTGNIIGKPGPIGIDRIWCVDHPNYCNCMFFNDVDACWEIYLRGYGAWSTECGVPRATAFLTVPEANNVPQGAFVGSNFFWTSPSSCNLDAPSHQGHDDVIWACKYAEVIFPKQSFNYFRPCGADRLQPTESYSNRCISSITDTVLTLEPTGQPTDISTGDIMWVCGTGNLDGMWTGSTDSGYQITLIEPRMASASLFPEQPIPDCGSGVVYKMRWPKMNSIICGRVDITSANNQNPVTCSLSEPTYLISGDPVSIGGSTSLAVINGTHTVTVIDNQTVALNGVNGISQSLYTGKGQMWSPFSPDWKWNDTTPKGDFTVRSWQYNYRDVGEYTRVMGQIAWNTGIPYDCTSGPADSCGIIPATPSEPRANQAACGFDQNIISSSCTDTCLYNGPCGPSVAYFSPNSETFNTNAKNYWSIPSGFTYGDGVYITMLQMIPFQTMEDPLYVSPPCACSVVTDPYTLIETHECDPNCSWEEDASCQPDVSGDSELGIPCHKYYPLRNQYEARCKVPTGAPPLMNGVYMGCLTTKDFAGGACPKGNMCYPPGQPLFIFPEQGSNICGNNALDPNIYATPWITLLLRENCVCNAGSFSQAYIDNGIGCPTDVVPAP